MATGRKQQRVSSSAVALVALLVLAAAQAGAARTCNVDVTSAAKACASYFNNQDPSRSCCDAVRGVDIKCACRYKSAPGANRAMELPSKCGFGPHNPCG